MASSRKSSKRVKAGTSKASSADRKKMFVDAYLSNGCNATQAALAAGYSKNGAGTAGFRLLKDVEISAQIANRQKEMAEKAGLSLERTLKEIARLAYSDPRKMFDEQGHVKPINELDDDTAAALASFEVEEITLGKGENAKVIGHTKKIKTWDKKGALDMAMRFHGAYASDNAQKNNDDAAKTEAVSLLELSRRMLFIMASGIKELEKA